MPVVGRWEKDLGDRSHMAFLSHRPNTNLANEERRPRTDYVENTARSKLDGEVGVLKLYWDYQQVESRYRHATSAIEILWRSPAYFRHFIDVLPSIEPDTFYKTGGARREH